MCEENELPGNARLQENDDDNASHDLMVNINVLVHMWDNHMQFVRLFGDAQH